MHSYMVKEYIKEFAMKTDSLYQQTPIQVSHIAGCLPAP